MSEVFDLEWRRRRDYLEDQADPAIALQVVLELLDDVGERAVDGTGRTTADAVGFAVEAVRAALTALDGVKVQQAPRRQPERSGGSRWMRFPFGPPPEPLPVRPRLVIDIDTMARATRDALESAGRLCALEPPPATVVTRPWAEDPGLISLLHDLVTAASGKNHEYAMIRLDQLRDDLVLEHRIKVVTFDGDNRDFFDFAPSANPGDRQPRTVRPALLHDGELLRRGEVRLPQEQGGPE